MSNYSIYTLGESQVTISNGAVLSGFTQGDGSHLMGETITLNSNAWTVINIADGGTDTNFSDSDTNQVLNGAQTIYGTSYANGIRIEAEYTLTVQDPDGNTYTLIGVNMNEAGAPNTYGTVEGLAFIGTFPPQGTPLTVVATAEGPPNTGGGSTPSGTYAVPPCFAQGTLIDTDRGPRPVETLRPGDRLKTLDDGAQPIRLCLATAVSTARLMANPGLRPIRILAGALGAEPAVAGHRGVGAAPGSAVGLARTALLRRRPDSRRGQAPSQRHEHKDRAGVGAGDLLSPGLRPAPDRAVQRPAQRKFLSRPAGDAVDPGRCEDRVLRAVSLA